MTNEESIAQIRATVESVLERARADEAYLAELRDDPERTLSAAGAPDDAARRVALDEFVGAEADTEGFARRPGECHYTCDPWTCLVTICAVIPWTS
jgi:hypothetical protein